MTAPVATASPAPNTPAAAAAPARADTGVTTTPATPPVVPVGEGERQAGKGWRDRVGDIAKRNNGQPRGELSERQKKADSAAANSTASSAASPAAMPGTQTTTDGTPPVSSPSVVTEITSDDGAASLRARDPESGKFADLDAARTYEFTIRDKQTGETKTYEKDLKGLIRLAQDGIATQRVQEDVKRAAMELQQFRQHLPQLKQAHEAAAKESAEYRALAVQLLTAPEHEVVGLRQQYAAENSPDKVAARNNQVLQQRLQQIEQEKQSWAVNQQKAHVGQAIGPAIQQVAALVGEDMASGKLVRDTAPLMVNGVIPPERFQQLVDYVNGPYRQWADGVAAERAKSAEQHKAVEDKTRQVQQSAQQAVNRAAAASRPVGHAAPDVAAKKPPKNFNQAVENIIRSRPAPSLTGSQSG